MEANERDDVCYTQPHSLADRVFIANDFVKRFHYPVPLAVDAMENTAGEAYAAWPERLYVIDEQARIAYRGGMGPFDYRPDELRAWLERRFPAARVDHR